MGYESRLIVVDRLEYEDMDDSICVYGDEIAQIDLSKMGAEKVDGKMFFDIFSKEIDFDLPYKVVGDRYEEWTTDHAAYRKDDYGNVCRWAAIDDVVDWLEMADMDYRRARVALAILKGIQANASGFGQLIVVHYGY